jgi:hypothetical protein
MNCPYDGANCAETATGFECEHCHREFQANAPIEGEAIILETPEGG